VIRFMNGYMVTSESEDAPSRMLTVCGERSGCGADDDHGYLYQFNWVKTANPALSCNPRNPTAWGKVTSPFAIGRVLVLSTIKGETKQAVSTGYQTPHEHPIACTGRVRKRLTDTLIQIPIPHIVNRASRPSHDERANSEEGQVC
jgi:hypothetical protein